MYTPDRVFVSDLKRIDPKLGCFFNERIANVIVTYKRATGQPVPIYRVQGPSGEFRIPDQRDIEAICAGDLSKEDIKTRLRKSSAYMHESRERQQRETAENIRHATIDDRRSFVRAFSSGKSQPFRKIAVKPKGKIFK